MTKLLSDEELRRSVTNALAPYTNSTVLIESFIHMFNTQKRLYATNAIGKKLPTYKHVVDIEVVAINSHIDKQRARIK